jgi:serine protease Do
VRRGGGLLALLALTSCTGQPAAAPQPGPACDQGGFAKVVEDTAPSVVTVQLDQGVGSGVVFKPDIVLTNQHVVGQNTAVTIVYADGRQSPGAVLASDQASDLAVVRTERKSLTPARFAGELPRPGCSVLAIGSPLGLQNTVTAGVVSGLHRSLPLDDKGHVQVDLIQTDAPISPGNSGGALLDNQGRVVGINEAYLPPQTGAVSLGFAIPASTATDAGEQLLTRGQVRRAFLGVSLGELTPSIRERLGVQADGGALVLGVEQNSPAAAAGLRPGDVITEFAGTMITKVDDLLAALRKHNPGEKVTLVVIHDGSRRNVDVVLGSRG